MARSGLIQCWPQLVAAKSDAGPQVRLSRYYSILHYAAYAYPWPYLRILSTRSATVTKANRQSNHVDTKRNMPVTSVHLGLQSSNHRTEELEATTRWGLTSTPPFRTIAEVAVTASFFQQKIQRCEEHTKNQDRSEKVEIEVAQITHVDVRVFFNFLVGFTMLHLRAEYSKLIEAQT